MNFAYATATPGQLVRADSPQGMIGYEYNATRTSCSGGNKTALFFHRANTTSCDVDADCGTGLLCGGKTGPGATGACFRGARCLTISSPSEDVIATITAFAGGSPPETCDGACLDAIDHVWATTGGALDLTAIQDPSTFYTTKEFDANGLPTKVVYGDDNADPSSGGQRVLFLTYDHDFPGKLAETRRQSDLETTGGTCSPSNATPCARTSYTYTVDGKVDTVVQRGFTYDVDAGGSVVPFTYTTDYDHDAQGRVTSVSFPVGSTTFEYWSTSDLKDGFLRYHKRTVADATYLTSTASAYDFFGNATTLVDPDGTTSCQTFDAARNYLTERRESMNNQTDCSAPHTSDIVTSYLRDSALRLMKIVNPDGSCMFHEHDARGRLIRTKRRDDCNAAATGDREEYTYSAEGLLTKIETFDAASTVTKRKELTYFDSRRLEKILNPVDTAKWTGFTYEARGMIESAGATNGTTSYNKTEWTFTVDGRVDTEKRFTSGLSFDTWSLLFDWLGNQQEVEDGDSKTTGSKRDDLGRVVELSSPDLGGYPTLRTYDGANRLQLLVERAGGTGERIHAFTYDLGGRTTEVDYASGNCFDSTGSPHDVPDIVNAYDALPVGVSCPTGVGCDNLTGRLAYTRVKLMCLGAAGIDGNWTLEQETFYSYDDAGRLIREYIKDETGRTADHAYEWTKNGSLSQVTLPSTAVIGWTYGSTGSNSDTDRIAAMWRTSTSMPIADEIKWEPFGPLKQYNQQNTSSTQPMRTVISHNLAYRVTKTEVELQSAPTTDLHYVVINEDEAGRIKSRVYFTSPTTIQDSYFKYDLQNRVLCETVTAPGTSCPTTGTSFKNSHTASTPFTAAGDWKQLRRPIAGYTGNTHDFTLTSGTHQIASVDQPGSTPLGATAFTYNDYGNRSSDDNGDTLEYDERTYEYDARRNITGISGKYKVGGAWHPYIVHSAFDAKNRRVYKSFRDDTLEKTATWFFYYDALDRLTEIRYTPDVSASGTYTTFQLFWLDDRLVLYWQTDYPSVTTSKRYIGTDETGRPIDMICWSASPGANCPRVWTINPDAWGFDDILIGPSVFQPILFAGQYKDDETVAWRDDGTTRHRPSLVLNGFRTYDPWIGAYLQVDPLFDTTRVPYIYANSNPVNMHDPQGQNDVDNGRNVAPGPAELCYLSNGTFNTGKPTAGSDGSHRKCTKELMVIGELIFRYRHSGFPVSFRGDSHASCEPTPRFNRQQCGLCMFSGALRSGGDDGTFMRCFILGICSDLDILFLEDFKNDICATEQDNFVCETTCAPQPLVPGRVGPLPTEIAR